MRYICTSIVATLVLVGTSFAQTAIAWGSDDHGQCDVPTGETFMQVAAGGLYTIGLRENGTAIAWGSNDAGQCNVPAGQTFVQVAAGFGHSIGIQTPTPVGSCCFGTDCITVSELLCAQTDGTWLNDSCDDCGEPTGACCVSSGCYQSTEVACSGFGGTWLGVKGGTCDDCPASCEGDTDGNGVVYIEDLLNVIGTWGPCP